MPPWAFSSLDLSRADFVPVAGAGLSNNEATMNAWARSFATDEAANDARKAARFARAARAPTRRIALDKSPNRVLDVDGRMHVGETNISKANVCPYRGEEIPNWQELGLEKDRIYQLYRDPDELRKGAATFNRLPVLIVHKAIDAASHRKDLVVGTTGSDAKFEDPYL